MTWYVATDRDKDRHTEKEVGSIVVLTIIAIDFRQEGIKGNVCFTFGPRVSASRLQRRCALCPTLVPSASEVRFATVRRGTVKYRQYKQYVQYV